MPVIDLFSKRKKREEGVACEVFSYDEISEFLRAQIIHIWGDALGTTQSRGPVHELNDAYHYLHGVLAREYGRFSLRSSERQSDYQAVVDYFMTAETERALDIIELSFRLIIVNARRQDFHIFRQRFDVQVDPMQAIEELNERFLEHGVGYTFVSGTGSLGQLVRKDREVLHEEVVLPALHLISEHGFEGANGEYLTAHYHYRHGRYKECLNECLNAFESTMKTICTKKNWAYAESDTAKSLIEICLKNELLPAFLQSHFGAVRATLESGIPSVRNTLGSHGHREERKDVPRFYAAYLLHETAATIALFVDAYKATMNNHLR